MSKPIVKRPVKKVQPVRPTVKRHFFTRIQNAVTTKKKQPVQPTVKRPNVRKVPLNNAMSTKKKPPRKVAPVRPILPKPVRHTRKKTPSPKEVSLNDLNTYNHNIMSYGTSLNGPNAPLGLSLNGPMPYGTSLNSPNAPLGLSLNGPNMSYGTSFNGRKINASNINKAILNHMIEGSKKKLHTSTKKRENSIKNIIQRAKNAKHKDEKKRGNTKKTLRERKAENQVRKKNIISNSNAVKIGNLNRLIEQEAEVKKAIKTFAQRKAENQARKAMNAIPENVDENVDDEIAYKRHQKAFMGASQREERLEKTRNIILELRRLRQQREDREREMLERKRMLEEDPSSIWRNIAKKAYNGDPEYANFNNSPFEEPNDNFREISDGDMIFTNDELPEDEADLFQKNQLQKMDEHIHDFRSIQNKIIKKYGHLSIQNIPVEKFIEEKRIEVDKKIREKEFRPANAFELYTFLDFIYYALANNSKNEQLMEDFDDTMESIEVALEGLNDKDEIEEHFFFTIKTLLELNKTTIEKLGRPPTKLEKARVLKIIGWNMHNFEVSWIMNKYWVNQPGDEKEDRKYDLNNIMDSYWAHKGHIEYNRFSDNEYET